MDRILITGGSGFVGEYLLTHAQKKYETYAIYYNNAIPDNNVHTIKFDLCQLSQIDKLLNDIFPATIIHTAAIANPDQCEHDPDKAITVNVKATEQLANWAQKNGARFIYTSTDMVFDGRRGNYKESDPTNPISQYSKTKVAAEQFIKNNNTNFVIARVALVYGIGITRHNSFFEKMIEKLTNGEKITLFDDQYRSPILVDNLAEALLELVEKKFIGTIHLGGRERISRWGFGWKACNKFDLPHRNILKGSMYDFEATAFRPPDISFNIELASKVLKTKLLTCDEGLERIAKKG